MGFIDTIKAKLGGLADQHGDKVDDGLDRAGDAISERTDGRFDDKIDSGKDVISDKVDDLA